MIARPLSVAHFVTAARAIAPLPECLELWKKIYCCRRAIILTLSSMKLLSLADEWHIGAEKVSDAVSGA